jgi:HlyD family secretion protein
MLRNWKFWILLILVLATGGGTYYYVTTGTANETAETTPDVQTAPVRQGDITLSAVGAGTVIPSTELSLAFQTSGTLRELLDEVGDQVKAGDVLARLDDSNAQEAVAVAELQLAEAAIQTDPETIERAIALAQIAVDQAEINLALAHLELEDLQSWTPDEKAVTLAQSDLESAQASYEDALARDASSGNNLTSYNISIVQAERDLTAAQEIYDVAFLPGREWELTADERTQERILNEREEATELLLRAQEALQVAQANFSVAAVNLNNNSAVSAYTAVVNAQVALANAQTGPTQEEIEADQKGVAQAELSLQQALLNLEAAADFSQAKISLSQAELNLDTARIALEQTSLVAPIDGTITAVDASPGETVGTTAFITLSDLDRPMLEVFVDETDLDMVGVGYESQVTFDALPDEVFSGQVVQVDPLLSSVNNVQVLRAVVQLDPGSIAEIFAFPVGLNATVDIIGGQALGALIVPLEALRELSPGEFAVFVMEGSEPRLQLVEIGLKDFTFAEILSGLELGDVVTTGIVETN